MMKTRRANNDRKLARYAIVFVASRQLRLRKVDQETPDWAWCANRLARPGRQTPHNPGIFESGHKYIITTNNFARLFFPHCPCYTYYLRVFVPFMPTLQRSHPNSYFRGPVEEAMKRTTGEKGTHDQTCS